MQSNSIVTHRINNSGKQFSMSGFQGEYVFSKIAASKQFYEVELLEDFRELLGEHGGIVIDVGANLGNHTIYFAGVMGRQVLAIEPDLDNFELLTRNVKANGLEQLVEAYRGAAWDKSGFVSLTQKIEGNRGTFAASESSAGIEATTIDDLVGNQTVGAIKIDVEGSEQHVLKGAQKVLRTQKPLVSLELHDSSARTEASEFLEEHGYVLAAISGPSDNYLWIHTEVNDPRLSRKLVESRRRSDRLHNTELNELKKLRNLGQAIRESVENLLNAPSPAQNGDTFAMGVSVERINSELVKLLQHVTDLENQISTGAEEIAGKFNRLEDFASKEACRSSEHAISRVNETYAQLSEQLGELHHIYGVKVSSAVDDVLIQLQKSSEDVSQRVDHLHSAFSGNLANVNNSEKRIVSQVHAAANSISRTLSKQQEYLLAEIETATKTLEELLAKAPYQASDFSPTTQPESTTFDHPGTSTRIDLDQKSSTEDPRFKRLLRAYGTLSRRYETVDPNGWDAEVAVQKVIESLDADTDLEDVLPLPQTSGSYRSKPNPNTASSPSDAGRVRHANAAKPANTYDKVRVGIASMPGREVGLRKVLEILHPQADEICVYLNGMDSVPATLPSLPNVSYFVGPDIGDRGKFTFVENFDGYYITCDDDIEYAPFHIQSLIDGIERYDRKAVVGWHGSIFKENFQEFYNPKYRQVLSFSTLRGKDTPVHLLGTGVCGFHTSTIAVTPSDFELPNMADAFLAILAKHQNVPMVVLAHEKGWAKPIDMGASISTVSLKRHEGTKADLDVGTTVTNLIKSNGPWTIPQIQPSYSRDQFTVAFVGRTDRDRWKKGGILKSAHLTVDMLNRFGVKTILEDIETGDPLNLSGNDADIVLIYVGDPERPDFRDVEQIIEKHASAGRKVVVNFSINGVNRRNELIVEKMMNWRSRFEKRVRLMIFSEATKFIPGLQPVRDLMVIIPKTISLPDPPRANFGTSKGIFLGDIAKMSDETLLEYPAQEWIKAIRRSLPGVPLYAVKQYAPKKKIPLDIDETWPFLTRETFAEKISKARLMISLVKYATFEMVPLEVASLGLPVVYPEMPQSLSEYLGLSGLSVDSPAELEAILPTLYQDPIVWRSYSESAVERARSSELNRLAGQTYLRLVALLND